MKKIILFIAFMLICSSAFAIKVGKVDADLENYMQVVYDSGELTAGVADLTVSGLDGDADETYQIIMRIKGGTEVTPSAYFMMLNGDSTSGHYGAQNISANTTAYEAQRNTTDPGFRIDGQTLTESGVVFAEATLSCSEDLSKTMILNVASRIYGTTVEYIGASGLVYNSTDNVTAITLHANQANGIGIGSRFIILRKVPDNVPGMLVGDLDIQGRVLGQWELVAEETVDVTLSGGLTVSGLSGDNDVLYKIESKMISNASNTLIQPNGDGGNNYGAQRIRGFNTTVSAIREDPVSYLYACGVNKIAGNGDTGVGEMLLYAKSGYVRPCLAKMINGIDNTTLSEIVLYGQDWANTTDNITSLYFAGIYGPGSYIRLWKLNLSEGDE